MDHGRSPLPAGLSADHLAQMQTGYWQRTKGPRRWLTDKMPHNFRHVGLIALAFPHAPIIYLRRDPRDVCLSIYSRPFPDGHRYACDLSAIAHFHRQSERLMAHWQRIMPHRILQVSYEDLVAEPTRVTQEITEFCGVPWQASCLEFHLQTAGSFTFSELQVREPLNSKGVGRWRNYERHLRPMLEGLQGSA
jgi:hypothetical protein